MDAGVHVRGQLGDAVVVECDVCIQEVIHGADIISIRRPSVSEFLRAKIYTKISIIAPHPRTALTRHAGVIKLNIPQPSLIQLLQLRLINLGHIPKILRITPIRLRSIRPPLLIPLMEPRRRNHRELDRPPLLLRHSLLHEPQLMQVRHRLGRVVRELGPRDDRISRHDLAILLDQADHVRVVQPEHAGLCVGELGGALELVPHEAPEARAVELAAGDGLEAQVALELDDVGDGGFFDGGEVCFRGGGAVADELAGCEEGLGPEEGAHVFGAEGRGEFWGGHDGDF